MYSAILYTALLLFVVSGSVVPVLGDFNSIVEHVLVFVLVLSLIISIILGVGGALYSIWTGDFSIFEWPVWWNENASGG